MDRRQFLKTVAQGAAVAAASRVLPGGAPAEAALPNRMTLAAVGDCIHHPQDLPAAGPRLPRPRRSAARHGLHMGQLRTRLRRLPRGLSRAQGGRSPHHRSGLGGGRAGLPGG